jgi:hypothetical protein
MYLILVAVTMMVIYILYRLFTPRSCAVLQTIHLPDCKIEIVDDDCQEGLPHTTDSKTIRMIRSVWDGPRRNAILDHERVHLSQKSMRDAWSDFYKSSWGYKCVSTPPSSIPADLITRLRPNPDTSDSPWAIWRDRWVFFPAFSADGTLRGAEILVWDLATKKLVPRPILWEAEFCGTGTCPHQYEHPHEISAEWLAATDDIRAPAAAKLFAWRK